MQKNKVRINHVGISVLAFIFIFITSDDVAAAEEAKAFMKLTCKVEERITRTVNSEEVDVDKRGWLGFPKEGDQIIFSMLKPRVGRKDYVLEITNDSPTLRVYLGSHVWRDHVNSFRGAILMKSDMGRVPFVRLTKNEIQIKFRGDEAVIGLIRHSPWDWGGLITWDFGSESGVFSRSMAVLRCRESIMPWDRLFEDLLSKIPEK
jgi:hypothetical protein